MTLGRILLLVLLTNAMSLSVAWLLLSSPGNEPMATSAELERRLDSVSNVTQADLDTVRAELGATKATVNLIRVELGKIVAWQSSMFNPEKGWRKDVTNTLHEIRVAQAEGAAERRRLEALFQSRLPGKCLGLGWPSHPHE